MPNTFNQPVHAFRGFAILNIVMIHAFAVILFYNDLSASETGAAAGILGALNGVLLHDATLYFTFISGMLFSMVLAERGFQRFFRSKFLYVFLPYLFFTLLYSSIEPSAGLGSPFQFVDGGLLAYLKDVGFNLLTGKALLIFWYLPVLIVLYLATPLLARLLATPSAAWLVWVIVCLPLFVSRTATEFTWESVVYFLGAYLVGMIVGKHYRATIEFIEQHILFLAVTSIVTTLAVVAYGYFQLEPIGVFNVAESAWYLQKLAFAGLVLLWFDRVIETVPTWLDVLADYAFAIYFIHMFLIIQLMIWMGQNQVKMQGVLELLFYMSLSLAIGIFGSLIIAWAFRKVLGKRSRYLIGA